jgi:hypothetical protein
MNKLEQSVAESFTNVKRDIVQLQEGFLAVDKTQNMTLEAIERMHQEVLDSKNQIVNLQKKIREFHEISLKQKSQIEQNDQKLRKEFDLTLKKIQLEKNQDKKAFQRELKNKSPLFVGNSKTKKLYIVSKEKQIDSKSRVYFFTKTQAKKAGYTA